MQFHMTSRHFGRDPHFYDCMIDWLSLSHGHLRCCSTPLSSVFLYDLPPIPAPSLFVCLLSFSFASLSCRFNGRVCVFAIFFLCITFLLVEWSHFSLWRRVEPELCFWVVFCCGMALTSSFCAAVLVVFRYQRGEP